MKKYILFTIVVLILALAGASFLVFRNINFQNTSVYKEECNSDIECLAAAGDGNSGIALDLPCFKGECRHPADSEEWIEFCKLRGEKNKFSTNPNKCNMDVVFRTLKKSSSDNDYIIDWSNSFKLCERLYSNEERICKLNVCGNLYYGDRNRKRSYPEKEQCNKEAEFSSADCKTKKGFINNKIGKANFCNTDSDCITKAFGCPFGCGSYINKNYDLSEILKEVEAYKVCPDSNCEYQCELPSPPICKNNRCVASY